MTPLALLAPRFVREYGCTEVEWLRWLPGAVRDQPLEFVAEGQARVTLPEGGLTLQWSALPPRRIALVTLPRLEVCFDFGLAPQDVRVAFLRYFDLYMQRGGG